MRAYRGGMDNGISVQGPFGCLCCLLIVGVIIAAAYSMGKRRRDQ